MTIERPIRRKPSGGRLARQEARAGVLLALPYLLGMALLVLLPLLAVLYMSLTGWSLLSAPNFVGFANYAKLAHNLEFRGSLGITALFTAGTVALNITAALLLASLLNTRLAGITAFRSAVFSPVVMPIVAWSLIWKFLLQPQGPLNSGLQHLGWQDANLLLNPKTALGTLILIEVLKSVGLNTVIFLSALQGVPPEQKEAARLDGAGAWQTYRFITVPMISPTLFLVFLITVIGALKVFTPIYVLTGGGPANATTTLIVEMFKQGFTFFEFGYAAAMAVILFAAVLLLTLLQWRLRKALVFYED